MKKIALIVLSTIVLYSCKKDSKNEPQPCTISTTAISGPYKITAVTYKENATATEIDYMNILFPDACQRDDVYTFKADGSYQIADVGLACSPSGNDNGTWALVGNNLQIDGDPVNLESFDCKLLIIVNTDTQVTGDRLKLTLTKQ